MKDFMEANIVPLYNVRGYSYRFSGQEEFSFSSFDDSVQIVYDILTCKLSCKYLQENASTKEIRLHFFIRNGTNYFPCSAKKIKSILFESDTLSNCGKDEHEYWDDIIYASKKIVNEVLPKLEELSCFLVTLKPQYYELLSVQTSQQAKGFAVAHQREMVWSAENQTWAYSWIQNLIPERAYKRIVVFEENLETIIKFAAFVGEMVCLKEEMKWTWATVPWTHERKFGLMPTNSDDEEDDGYDVMAMLLDFWNFSSDLYDIPLFPR